jgi:hypothetical protein
MNLVVVTLSLAIGSVLVWSALAKLVAVAPAQRSVDVLTFRRYRHLVSLRRLVAAEFVLGLSLLGGAIASFTVIALAGAAAAGLFSIFAVQLARTLRTGAQFGCSCFGGHENSLATWWTVVRAVVLAVAASVLTISAARAFEPENLDQIAIAAALLAASTPLMAAASLRQGQRNATPFVAVQFLDAEGAFT